MHVAHLNWGVLKAGWEDPLVAEFVENIDRVNAIAGRAKGFVWRMTDDDMEDAQTGMEAFGPPDRVASTLSVWETVGDLDHFVHNTVHGVFMSRRDEWFEVIERPQYVLWFIAEGHRPTIAEAADRRALYRARGAGPDAFDFNWFRKEAA